MQFLDAQDLNTEVTGCIEQLVGLSLETHVSHMKQHLSLPLSQLELTEDFSHYTRDPERSLQPRRLMLVIKEKRPPSYTSEYSRETLYSLAQKEIRQRLCRPHQKRLEAPR